MVKLIADTTDRSKACRINLTGEQLGIAGFKAGDDITRTATPGEIKLTKSSDKGKQEN
jgi:hypothetical protein